MSTCGLLTGIISIDPAEDELPGNENEGCTSAEAFRILLLLQLRELPFMDTSC